MLALTNGTPEDKDASWVHARLGDYLLGYDLDPDIFKALLKRQGALAASLPADDPVLLESENALLDLFSDLGALYRPRTEAETSGTDGLATVNTQAASSLRASASSSGVCGFKLFHSSTQFT